MPLDPDRLLGAKLPGDRGSWDPTSLLLYHLAIGAGADPARTDELAYTWEERLRPLPTFAATTAVETLMRIFDLPAVDCDPLLMLHGEHDLTLSRPLPLAASVVHTGVVEALYDKGRGALAIVRIETRNEADSELLYINRFSLFMAGQGGFGGERGPSSQCVPPEGDPDRVREIALSPQQALLFRLLGDRHPVHVDPDAARARGFERPILHGLCTFGVAGKVVVDDWLGGDVERLVRLRARFANVVYPGETLRFSTWRAGDQVAIEATAVERGVVVLSHGAATVRGS